MIRSLVRTLLLLIAVGGLSGRHIPAAPNLLLWNGWQPWNPQFVTQLQIDPTEIAFVPYDPSWNYGSMCGLEQEVTVPVDGWYQLHFMGAGGVTGYFQASWTIDGNRRDFDGRHRQMAWSFWLPAGTHTLRFTTDTSNQAVDWWVFDQPILRQIVAPGIDLDLEGRAGSLILPQVWLVSQAHVIVMAPQRRSSPLSIPGFEYGLELAPTSQIVVVATSSAGTIVLTLPPFSLFGQSWPSFYLQPISLTPPATFGSRLYVAPWSF